MAAVNTYTGVTRVSGGKLQIGTGGTTATIAAASVCTVDFGATLEWYRNDTASENTISNTVSGAGIVAYRGDNSAAAGDWLKGRFTCDGVKSGHTGEVRITGCRVSQLTQAQIGTGNYRIFAGGQMYVQAPIVVANNITAESGTGWSEASGQNLGHFRGTNTTSLNGTITLNATSSRFSSTNGNMIFNGNIVGAGNFETTFAGTHYIRGTANNWTGNTITGASTTIVVDSASSLGSTNYAGNVNMGAGMYWQSSVPQTISGVVSGGALLMQSQPATSTLALTGVNTFTGIVSIQYGILSVSHASALGAGVSGNYIAIQNGGTLRYTGTGVSGTTLRNLYWNSGNANIDVTSPTGELVLNTNGGTRNQWLTKTGPGTVVVASTINVAGGPMVLSGGTFTHAGSGYLTTGRIHLVADSTLRCNTTLDTRRMFVDGGFSGSGNLTVDNTIGGANAGIVFRSTAYTGLDGNLTVLGGGVYMASGTSLAFANSNVSLVGATFGLGSVTYATGSSASVKSVSGTGTVSLSTNTLTVGTNNGTGAFAGTVIGTGVVIKSGTGTQTFSGNNTYSGMTNINAGAATAGNNNAFGTGTINLPTGGTLNRSGFTLPNVVINTGGVDNP